MTCVAMAGATDLRKLFVAALNGDEAAYRRFLERAAVLVRGYARRRAGGSLDPEDIVQETLLSVHLKRHTWRADAPVEPWLYAIARYKLIDALRRTGRYTGRHIDVDVSELADMLPAEAEDETISERDLGRVLDTLPDGQRNVVEAISVDGRSISETAKQFGMNEGAVRVALHRGLKAIAVRFGKS